MEWTLKDSRRNKTARTGIEVLRRSDRTFDLFLNEKLVRSRVPGAYLEEELSHRFGLCREEYASILREIEKRGRAQVVFESHRSK